MGPFVFLGAVRASMRASVDEAIGRGEPGVPLSHVIAEFEAEHGSLNDEG
jgi:phage baseplate assembly protein W